MHIPVLLHEVTEGLQPKKGDTLLDCTVGGGGHSEALCEKIGAGKIVCMDQDADAIERSKSRLQNCGCEFHFFEGNFRGLDQAIKSFGVVEVNGAIFDLGFSTDQLEVSQRGFSFQKDEPLLMTMSKDGTLTARDILNDWDEENIEAVILGYGEERFARKIARAVVERRKSKKFETTAELAELISGILRRKGKIHPATKTFQALRIAVNDELRALEEALPKAFDKLATGGRIAVISFHSLEDRIVKRYFQKLKKDGQAEIITKKPITATDEEIKNNPRSRSAKLRIVQKI